MSSGAGESLRSVADLFVKYEQDALGGRRTQAPPIDT